jgi:parallel beta-helix repeat protein
VKLITLVTLLLGVAMTSPIAGELEPPGSPTPTPGPEPRTAVNAENTPGDVESTFRITQPGSYYLAGSITGEPSKSGVEIVADGVTLDLMGFELRGVAGTLDGIRVEGEVRLGLAVRGGSVREWGRDGMFVEGVAELILADMRFSRNGGRGLRQSLSILDQLSGGAVTTCTFASNEADGLWVRSGWTVTNSVAFDNGDRGFFLGDFSTVTGLTARGNGEHGIQVGDGSTVGQCTAAENGTGGLQVGGGSTVVACTANRNGQDGIRAPIGGSVIGCTASGNGRHGIFAPRESLVRDCSCTFQTSGAGIFVDLNDCRVEGNLCTGNQTGIDVDGTENLIVRNMATGNTSMNFDIVGGNQVGTIRASPVGAGPWDNFEF